MGKAEGTKEELLDSSPKLQALGAFFAGCGEIDEAVERAEQKYGGETWILDFPGVGVGAGPQ